MSTTRTGVCLVGPTMLFPPRDVARFVADNPQLDVHWVDYLESPEQRMARVNGTLSDELRRQEPPLSDDSRAALRAAQAIIALDLPSGIAELAPNVRFVQAVGAGIEWLLAHRLDEHNVGLARASGVASASIAEFVIARLLEHTKRLREIEANQRDHRWDRRHGSTLRGRTFGVAGLGAIGRDAARLAKAFGMGVEGCRRSAQPGDTDPDVDVLWPADRLDAMLGRCDAVLLSAPATAATSGLFDAGRFAAMRKGAVFINVSRGSLVNEADLVAALRNEHLGAAIIDVASQEPAPADHPFWDAPNLYLSPHCSASFEGYAPGVFALFLDNLARVERGEPLRNEVIAERGY